MQTNFSAAVTPRTSPPSGELRAPWQTLYRWPVIGGLLALGSLIIYPRRLIDRLRRLEAIEDQRLTREVAQDEQTRAELMAQVTQLRAEREVDVAQLWTELRAQVAQLRAEREADVAQLRAEREQLRQCVCSA